MADQTSTVRLEDRRHTTMCLLVLVGERYERHALPETGTVSIGRGDDCDIQIDDGSVSRHHATVRTADASIATIEDHASANGIKVQGKKIAADTPFRLQRYDVIEVGRVQIVLQHVDHTTRMRFFWSRTEFEARVVEACARSARDQSPMAVIRISNIDNELREELRLVLVDVLDDEDVATEIEGGVAELLITSRPHQEVIGQLTRESSAWGLSLNFACAIPPADGLRAEELLSSLRPARNESQRISIVDNSGMKNLYALAEKIAAGDLSILIFGETGTGKEMLARHIHLHSPRKDAPFVQVNCAAAASSVLERELFGYAKGAFAEAEQGKEGEIEAASGGVLFLDEIGDMSLELQGRLLRVIEDKEVRRIGSNAAQPADIRMIVATNSHLEEALSEGRFRQDLYFRLSGISLDLPPLRQRQDEIPIFFEHFHQQYAEELGVPHSALTAGAAELLSSYSWPGNLRELRNVAERATLVAEGKALTTEHLPERVMRGTLAVPELDAPLATLPPGKPGTRSPSMTRERIVEVLESCAGNQTRAAKKLGVSRRTLTKWLGRYALPRPRKDREES